MPKGIPNKIYTAKCKVMVIETMQREGHSYTETERQLAITKDRVRRWEPDGVTSNRLIKKIAIHEDMEKM